MNGSIEFDYRQMALHKLLEERVEKFKEIHLRYPTLTEEQDEFSRIDEEEVTLKAKELMEGNV